MTAAELMAKLDADTEYQARMAAEREALDARARAWRTAEQPLIEELRQIGLPVTSVWDLVNTAEPYPEALPVLVDHLRRDYPARVTEGIARALAVKESNRYWQILRDAYRSADEYDVQSGLAAALAASARPENYPQLLELVADESRGVTRVIFLQQVAKLGGRDGLAVLEGLQDDEQLGSEASALVARRSRRRAGGRKRRTSD